MPLDPGTRLLDGDEINRTTATSVPIILTPADGAKVTLTNNEHVYYVNPPDSIEGLTLVLPWPMKSGGLVALGFGQPVGSLVILDEHGNAVDSTMGATGVGMEYRFVNPTIGWVRWR